MIVQGDCVNRSRRPVRSRSDDPGAGRKRSLPVPTDRSAGRGDALFPQGTCRKIAEEECISGGEDSPQIGYLKALARWDAQFPGFEHETEGSKVIDGIYHVMCVK